MSKQVTTRAIAQLKNTVFVREHLNRDHVEKLADLLRHRVKLPPITINRDDVIIDGRHRVEAYEVNGIERIPCIVEDLIDEADIIARAHELNAGGPLPPTQADLEHTVSMLLARSVAKKDIASMLGLPKGMARRYIDAVEARRQQKAHTEAFDAVVQGELTLPQAALRFRVDLADLQGAIQKQPKKVTSESLETHLKATRNVSRGFTARIRAFANLATEMVQDGLTTRQEALNIFEKLSKLNYNQIRALKDARRRFEASTSDTDE